MYSVVPSLDAPESSSSTCCLKLFAPLNQQHWRDGQDDRNADHDGLDAKHQTHAISCDPGRLEVSHGEATASPPHVQNRRDTRRLFRVLFQGIGRDGSGRGQKRSTEEMMTGHLHNGGHHADIHHDPTKSQTDPVLAKVHRQAISE